MNEEQPVIKTGYVYGKKDFAECTKEELITVAIQCMADKNSEAAKTKALLDLLKSPFPNTVLWKSLVETVVLLTFCFGLLHEAMK